MPYGTYCLQLPRFAFFPLMFRSLLTFGTLVAFGFGMSMIIMPNTWIELIISCGILGLASIALVYFVYFTQDERKHILSIFGIRNKKIN
ncbi:MAG: hypothetical protein FD133_465 [Erysipelotrichaceae bacterium]|nr:MAG: hypothetical protein FD133_465 [Erysipelotrichaceae bacterium]